MDLELNPNKGAGQLAFGDKREKVRHILRHLVFRTYSREPETDFYEEEGLILGYDVQDELEYIEIIQPSSARFKDICFFELDLLEVLARMSELGFCTDYADGGYDFASVGIVLYCPQGRLESVAIYREGYYDDLF